MSKEKEQWNDPTATAKKKAAIAEESKARVKTPKANPEELPDREG